MMSVHRKNDLSKQKEFISTVINQFATRTQAIATVNFQE